MRVERRRMTPRVMGRLGDDRGSGVVLALAITAVVVTMTMSAVGVGALLAARQHVIGAADSAALAAADVAIGIAPGDPCEVAGRVARSGGVRVQSCTVDGLVVTLGVAGAVGGIAISVRSRAGPPP